MNWRYNNNVKKKQKFHFKSQFEPRLPLLLEVFLAKINSDDLSFLRLKDSKPNPLANSRIAVGKGMAATLSVNNWEKPFESIAII